MIVTETPRGWRCVTQPDHAVLSREVLALWRRDDFPRHPRRPEILFAAREHDNGWQGADAAPRLDPRGDRPLDFTALANADRLTVWQRGIERYRTERPYVAALIIEHARYLHEARHVSRGGAVADDPWSEFLAGLPAARDEALAAADAALDTLLSDYRWLHIADLVSLAVCAGWRKSFGRWGQQGVVQGNTVVLRPFPLAGPTAFSVPCRYLEPALYASDAAMATALASCRWERWTVRLAS